MPLGMVVAVALEALDAEMGDASKEEGEMKKTVDLKKEASILEEELSGQVTDPALRKDLAQFFVEKIFVEKIFTPEEADAEVDRLAAIERGKPDGEKPARRKR